MEEKIKTIYEMKLHEAMSIETDLGKVEITRVPGGWVYAFDYPGYRQSPMTFVPFDKEFLPKKKTEILADNTKK